MNFQFASALSTAIDPTVRIEELSTQLASALNGTTGGLAILFAKGDEDQERVMTRVSQRLRDQGMAKIVIGCTCESIIGGGQEVEDGPGLSAWVAAMPETQVRPFHLRFDPPDIVGGWDSPELPDLTPEPPAGHERVVLILGDPFSFPADRWLKATNSEHRGLRILGGMASGGDGPGHNRLLWNEHTFDHGAVGVWLEGPFQVHSIVSQGCRPVGRPMIVTKIDQNSILELGRRPVMEMLRDQISLFDENDRAKAHLGLHIGRVINEYQEKFQRGDFLVRNVLGIAQDDSLLISDLIRVGQTVQFHVRDAETAHEDLESLLQAARSPTTHSTNIPPREGVLIFTCNGRGARLFAAPHHDAGLVQSQLGPVPAAGFFAMGELGPIGGQNFVHGFTASIALFRPNSAAPTVLPTD